MHNPILDQIARDTPMKFIGNYQVEVRKQYGYGNKYSVRITNSVNNQSADFVYSSFPNAMKIFNKINTAADVNHFYNKAY